MGKKNKNKTPKEFKISKKLDPYIKDYYKYEIGVPDLSQNWLELFHGTVIDDLFTIMHSNSDNQLKSDYVEELLEPFGFTSKGGGLGTNILVLTHPYYPGVVFKIALDENGIADNFNDCLLQDMVPQYARVYARHPSGLVTVQERYFVMKPEWMSLYRNDILHALRELSKDFLIADLTPSMVLNYGIDRKGKFVFIDGSDLYPLKQIKAKDRLRCVAVIGSDKNGELKRCRGKCKYNDDFSQMVCEKCGRTYIPIELRPRKEEYNMKNIFSDGFTIDDREELERRSREAMRTGIFEPYYPDHLMNTNNDEEDEEDMAERINELPEGYHIQVWKQGKERFKIAVQDGYRVVALDKNGNPVVKPDKNHKDDTNRRQDQHITQKKSKHVEHTEETIRVPQEVHTYENNTPVHQPKPTKQLLHRIMEFRENQPEEYKNYVKELIEFIGWDMIDSFREDGPNLRIETLEAEKAVLMKENEELKAGLEDANEAERTEKGKADYHETLRKVDARKLKQAQDFILQLKSENDDIREQNKKLGERVAELEEDGTNMQEPMRAEIDTRDRTIKELHDRINVLDREKAELTTANEKMGQTILDLQNKLVVKNEMTNSIIQKMQSDENPNCIHYQVVEETETESSELPGIYFHVRGDITEAYENYGLPIYVCVEGYNATALAINTVSLRESIYDAYDDVIEDTNENPTIIISSGEDDDEEPAPNANFDISEEVNQEEIAEDLRSYTNILDEEDDDDEDEDDELSDEEENNLFHRMMDNPNPHSEEPDPRYEMAKDWSDHI